MSTLLYGTVTRKREQAEAGLSTGAQPPGVSTYVDALAALVPAEVLALHAVVISRSTTTVDGATSITAPDQLVFWFWFLFVASGALFIVGKRAWPRGWDLVRMAIPPLAFAGWTMLQPTTAFDAIAGAVTPDWRWTIGLALGLILGTAATLLGIKADQRPPTG